MKHVIDSPLESGRKTLKNMCSELKSFQKDRKCFRSLSWMDIISKSFSASGIRPTNIICCVFRCLQIHLKDLLNIREIDENNQEFQSSLLTMSVLSHRFWATELLKTPTASSYAVCCDQQGKWTQSRHHFKRYINWICEK